MLIFFYMVLFAFASLVVINGNAGFLGLAFDSGGVTTGPITVPFIMALGVGIAGTLGGNKTAFMAIDKSSYSIQFSLTPAAFAGQLWVYGYASESSPTSGIGVCLTSLGVTIKNGKGTVALSAGQTYEIEVGFVALFNGNTVYTFVKVNGTVVAWEFIESYHKTAGNIAIVSKNTSDSFTIA